MRLFLAPMEGVVDAGLREVYASLGGVDIFVTEFIRVTETLLPHKIFTRYCPELLTPLPIPVRVQLLGSEPEWLARNAQRAAELGACAIDLNFGCPAKTVNRHRGGACLLQEPETLYSIVSAVRAAVPATIPVTAKMRLGFNAREGYRENAQAMAAAGAAEIIVHARSKADGYHPPAYWPAIGEIREALRIPVIANGEIWSVQDFLQCREESGCEDFMLGRGLLAQPDLALAIKACAAGRDYQPLAWQEVLDRVWGYHRHTLEHSSGRYLGNRLKQWLMYLQRQYPAAQDLFEQIKRLREVAPLEEAYQRHRQSL